MPAQCSGDTATIRNSSAFARIDRPVRQSMPTFEPWRRRRSTAVMRSTERSSVPLGAASPCAPHTASYPMNGSIFSARSKNAVRHYTPAGEPWHLRIRTRSSISSRGLSSRGSGTGDELMDRWAANPTRRMTIREVLAARRQKLLILGLSAWVGFALTGILAPPRHLPWLVLPFFALFLAAALLNIYWIRCPRCRGAIGLTSAVLTGRGGWLGRRIDFCPYCGVSLDESWSKDPGRAA